jgi:succinate dehydrogenase/fumarate reductase flavoprotein subunit
MRLTFLAPAAVFLLAAGPVSAAAQATPQQQPPAEIQALAAELQQVEARLAPLHMQALQDPELQQEHQAIAEAVRDAIVRHEPDMEETVGRLDALMREAQQAQASGDAERIEQLAREGMELQPLFAEAQARAMAEPEIRQRIEAFQRQIHARIT